ncbi:MAG: YkgJ family cysteine cluster protein [archaeon]|nr:YkgJ family cysteine cluster protein [Candidatus Bathyarchaeum sp.]
MNNTLAILTLDTQNHSILGIQITQKQFKFKCKRNASLCCKLGGPILTENDINKIKLAGYSTDDFLELFKTNAEHLSGCLKTRTDGSCIFLNYDKTQNLHNCSIYNSRPSLCKLYPFTFELLESDRIALQLIPCCLGLNDPEGKVLDEKFVRKNLLEPLFDAIELSKTRQ